ncbi:MAG: amino acid racemase [Myxococcaceae bacterium]
MSQHIGIVACTAEGASLCYRTLCSEGPRLLGTHAHPEISLHNHSLADYVRCLDNGDRKGIAELMLSSARKLQAAGAQFLICPDNTIHQAMELVLPNSPLPWLHIAEVVADEAAHRNYKRLGLTGTRWLVDSEVYPEKLAARQIDYRRPNDADRGQLQRVIMNELVEGMFIPESTQGILEIIKRLRGEGCDAVVLGCTELPLVIDELSSPLPLLDSTRLLARAALKRAA